MKARLEELGGRVIRFPHPRATSPAERYLGWLREMLALDRAVDRAEHELAKQLGKEPCYDLGMRL
jgi:hypothetical protein